MTSGSGGSIAPRAILSLVSRFTLVDFVRHMQLSLRADHLRIELTRMERVIATHGKLIIIPFSQICGVSTDRPVSHWREIHIPGVDLPGLIKAGTFSYQKQRSFWYAHPKRPVLSLELVADADYQTIVLTLDDNLGWRDRIQAACQG
jgi:hypothetical protein